MDVGGAHYQAYRDVTGLVTGDCVIVTRSTLKTSSNGGNKLVSVHVMSKPQLPVMSIAH